MDFSAIFVPYTAIAYFDDPRRAALLFQDRAKPFERALF
jgi:hypothetical protein